MTVVTLTQARRNLAEVIGGYRLIRTGIQETPPAGNYVGVATGADAKRHIVSTDLAWLDAGGTSTAVDSALYKHAAAYIPSVPIQRIVAEKGYQAAITASDYTDQTTPIGDLKAGMLTLAEILGAVLAAGVDVELHKIMPPIAREHGRGLHACINRALRNMTFRDVISVTTVSGAGRYDMSANTWITKARQLIGVYDSESDATLQPPELSGGGELVFDAHTPYLQIDSEPSSTTFYAAFRRPIGSWVRTSTGPDVWGNSTAGLVAETDAVFVDPDKLTTCSYYYACEALMKSWRRQDEKAAADWQREMTRVLGPASMHLLLDDQFDTKPSRGSSASMSRSTFSSNGTARTSWP